MDMETGTQILSTRYRVERMAISVEAISARIARLAEMLGLDLRQESEVQRVLGLDGADSGDARRQHMLQELHALLVMRYGIAKRYAQDVGVAATRSILLCAQEQFVRDGFAPGSSGADVSRLFGED